MSKTQGNLTEGPILKVLTKLALPIMASAFLGTAYNITDMAWIGQLGSKAVAGVGVGGMYAWLSSGLAALSRMGGQVYVAQLLGKGSERKQRHTRRRLFGYRSSLVCCLGQWARFPAWEIRNSAV